MAAQVRQALQRMGMTNEAATFSTNANGLGLSTLDRWRDVQTDDNLSNIVKNLKSPGGTVGVGAHQHRHPGYVVSMIAIGNIKVMRLALKYHQHVQRAVTPANITQAWVDEWEFLVGHQEMVAKTKIDESDLPKIKSTDWARTKERIVDHFSVLFGEEGVPLAYILRDEDTVPAEADDPRQNYDGDHIQEMIRRAPHQGRAYHADNRKMCSLLKKICFDTPAYEYVTTYTANGRAAWNVLMQAYLGPQHTENQATIYEAKIANATYDGETSRYGYDQYVNNQRSSHTRLQALRKHGYNGMGQGTLIRHHLVGIKNDKLKAVIELVRGNDQFNTFDLVTRRIKDTIVTLKPTKTATRTVSSVVVKNKRGEEIFPDVEPDTSMQDKFYKPADWGKLTRAQKKGVMLARSKRQPRDRPGGRPGGRPGNDDKEKTLKRANKKLKKQVASLTRKVAAVDIADDDDDDGSSEEDDEPPTKKSKKTTNRTHPNLSRGRRGGG